MPCLQWGMTARILSIGTALPDTRVEQSALRDLFAAQPGFDRKSQRLVGAAFDAAAIDTRHVVLPQLAGRTAARVGGGGRGARLLPPPGGPPHARPPPPSAPFASAPPRALSAARH